MEQIRFTRNLRRDGYADAELARLRRQGTIRSVRRGAYVLDGAPEPCREEQHREQITAAVGELKTAAVVSHMSAAVLHGLPLWSDELGKVHSSALPEEDAGQQPPAGQRAVLDVAHLSVSPAHWPETTVISSS